MNRRISGSDRNRRRSNALPAAHSCARWRWRFAAAAPAWALVGEASGVTGALGKPVRANVAACAAARRGTLLWAACSLRRILARGHEGHTTTEMAALNSLRREFALDNTLLGPETGSHFQLELPHRQNQGPSGGKRESHMLRM